jgi:hypothetical protein
VPARPPPPFEAHVGLHGSMPISPELFSKGSSADYGPANRTGCRNIIAA